MRIRGDSLETLLAEWERRLREKLGELAAALGTEPAPPPPVLREELARAPVPVMPACLGVDSSSPCTAR